MPIIQSRRNGRLPGERTTEQALVMSGVDGELMKRQPRDWNQKVRKMRRDPTIGFARTMYTAPILAAEWTVVSDDPVFKDAESLIYNALVPHRRRFLKSALRGRMDWGWQGFEVVLKYTDDGAVSVRKLKPLLQDITTILVDPHGRFAGLRNIPVNIRGLAQDNLHGVGGATSGYLGAFPWVDLKPHECLLISRDTEGTDWYGEATMYCVEAPYDSWQECEVAAKRFDTKIAGAHWIVRYPVGTTQYRGEPTDNYEIAKDILSALEASGKIAVPVKIDKMIEEMNGGITDDRMPWKIDMISASGSSESSFVGRQRYLDSLKVRGLRLPERAILEGQFGTRAEAEAHADFAIDAIEMEHQEILEDLNSTLVNRLLILNFGRDYKDKVKIQASPLTDVKRAHFRELYSKLLDDQTFGPQELQRIDRDALRETLGVPTRSEDEPLNSSQEQDAGTNNTDEAVEQGVGSGSAEPTDGTRVEEGEQPDALSTTAHD